MPCHCSAASHTQRAGILSVRPRWGVRGSPQGHSRPPSDPGVLGAPAAARGWREPLRLSTPSSARNIDALFLIFTTNRLLMGPGGRQAARGRPSTRAACPARHAGRRSPASPAVHAGRRRLPPAPPRCLPGRVVPSPSPPPRWDAVLFPAQCPPGSAVPPSCPGPPRASAAPHPRRLTLMVSSGCPTNTRQTPPKPPAKKFFTGLMGCGCSAMAAAVGEERGRGAASLPSRCRPLRPATFTPVPGRAARRDTGGGERGAGRERGGPCPRRRGGGGRSFLRRGAGHCHRALAPAKAGTPASPEGAEPASRGGATPPARHPPPPSRVSVVSTPRPSVVVGPVTAAAPAPPGGSDATRRPVLPACRQRRPGRRSPGRRSLPPPPAALRRAR